MVGDGGSGKFACHGSSHCALFVCLRCVAFVRAMSCALSLLFPVRVLFYLPLMRSVVPFSITHFLKMNHCSGLVELQGVSDLPG